MKRLGGLIDVGWLVLAALAPAAAGEPQWTRFRGPNGCGAVERLDLPAIWTPDDYRWRVELPGSGFSSPVIWQDRLYLTTTDKEQSTLFALALSTQDGSIVWQRALQVKPHPEYKANCDASATPAIDQDRVYLAWATPDEHVVVALDRRQGRELWRRDLGPYVAEDGFATSPVLAGDVVVLVNDQDEGGTSSIVALDRATGKTRWTVARDSQKATFSTPCLFQPPGARPQIILLSRAHGITSLDPESGAKNWELADVFDFRTTGSPLVAGGLVFGTNGGGTAGKYLVAARLGVPEKKIEPQVLYRVDEAVPYVPTPVADWPLVFLLSDRGVASCIDGPTGKVHWRQRVGGDWLGSPVRVGRRIYALCRSGEAVVWAASDKFELLGRIDLGEPSNSTPSVADGVMYIRTLSHLMALAPK